MRAAELGITDGAMVTSGKPVGNMQEVQSSVSVQDVKEILDKLQWDQGMLRRAIGTSLLTFGEPVMKTVLWHLKTHGFFLESDDKINMRLFFDHLESLIGGAAYVVLDEIVGSLIQSDYSRLGQGSAA
jgi:hypothetical protein